MYQIRGEGFWAKCWRDEPVPLPSFAGRRARLLTTAPTHTTPSDRPITAAIERWQHLGGVAAYAALGVEFEPAATGQLAIHVPEPTDGEDLEQACFGLTEACLTLARELGPGHLALTRAQNRGSTPRRRHSPQQPQRSPSCCRGLR